jgi:chromosome segregation ATPase
MVEFQTLKCKCDTLQSKIGISQSIQDFNQAQDYQNKITDLKAQIT